MSLGSQLTLLVPTKNRSFLLSRMLAYYAKVKLSSVIFLGDGSDAEEYEKNLNLVSQYRDQMPIIHRRFPQQLSSNLTVMEMLKEVNTPYCSWAGDDDFAVPSHIEKGVSFLNDHPDFNVVCGEMASLYFELRGEKFHLIRSVPIGCRHICDERPSERMIQVVFPWWAKNTHSIERKERMLQIWEQGRNIGLMENTDYNNLFESYFNIANVLFGKQAFIPGLARVVGRRLTPSLPSLEIRERLEILFHWHWPGPMERVVETLARNLMLFEKMDYPTAKSFVLSIFCLDFGPYIKQGGEKILFRLKRKLPDNKLRKAFHRLSEADIYTPKKFIQRLFKSTNHQMSLKNLMNKHSFYYSDFSPVYETLVTGQ